jgi:hypothetical protein
LTRCERLASTFLALIQVACIPICPRVLDEPQREPQINVVRIVKVRDGIKVYKDGRCLEAVSLFNTGRRANPELGIGGVAW